MKKFMAALFACTVSFAAAAQSWNLIDMGVGLIIEDAEYDKVLKIAQRGNTWDMKELYEQGAFAGTYKGNQRFGAWIKGPVQADPVWYYSYVITYPDGKTFSSGRSGFYLGGHGTIPITSGSYTDGNWKIDFTVWNKKTNESRYVGSVQFTTTWGKPATGSWQLIDSGVGILDQSNYDTKLVVLNRGNRWSQKRLYEEGYLANRTQIFATWLAGPPVSTFTDANGFPIWMYSIKLTYPNGTSQEFGPSYFYTPGFATMFLNVAGGPLGEWIIDYYLVRRGTQEKVPVSQVRFTLTE
ncbi:MAG: hypothetical protein LDL24_11625 [Treponema sp.]|nr:hypothetical protein [Treponema sp.]